MSLKSQLDELYDRYDARYESSDPICLVRRFDRPEDIEIAALMMASLAFGRVDQILRAGEMALRLMDQRPADFVRTLDPAKAIREWRRFYYRMVRSTDLLRLLFALQYILREHGSLARWVQRHYRADDLHLGWMWSRCVADIRRIDAEEWMWTRSRGTGFRHLLPDPGQRSAAKRAFLFLRWMVRQDSIDLGLWGFLPKEKLLIPVDTHIGRLSENLGWIKKAAPTLKTAQMITQRLKWLDAEDPVKYDFALSRLGILQACPKRKNPVNCETCSIEPWCIL